MSVNYASGLSTYENKGVCGLPEVIDAPNALQEKVAQLSQWVEGASCVVLHVGAGISTSTGIPDFRGPNGVWTLEKKGITKTETSISFDEAKPSFTHMALRSLLEANKVHFVISQNVDGLFLKTGIERKHLAELHGNFYLDECTHCDARYVRNTAATTMGLMVSDRPCPRPNRPCRGLLRDTILDWEHELPPRELQRATKFALKSDVIICLGTSLQINPAAELPFLCQKGRSYPRKVAIVNLQKTKHDDRADLVVHDYVDNVMKKLCKLLEVEVKGYNSSWDLTKFDAKGVIKEWQ